MKFSLRFYAFLLLLIVYGCTGSYYIKNTQASQTRIKPDSLQSVDSTVVKMIAPYKQKLDAQMNEVIAVTETDLKKEQPEGTLCDLVAEASMAHANKYSDKPADFCVMNYGGVRIPFIQQGNITVGKIYELMPFDNQLEILEVSGITCKQLLDLVAKNGGWPVSGVRMKIGSNGAEDIFINNQPFDKQRTYLLVTSDYIANGGDNASMLSRATKRTPLNYKMRDAIIDYLKEHTANKTPLNIQKDGRITVAQP